MTEVSKAPPFHPQKKLTVVNFFGAPSAGKTTARSGLFHELKKKWIRAEEIKEYAKELCQAGCQHMLAYQNHVFSTQELRQRVLIGSSDIAVTDAPLLLSAFYAPEDYPLSFKQLVFDHYNAYQNINIYVERSHEYQIHDRVQTPEESEVVNDALLDFLTDNGVPFYKMKADDANGSYLTYWLAKKGLIHLGEGVKPFTPEDVPPPHWLEPMFANVQQGEDGVPVPFGGALHKNYLEKVSTV